MNSFKEKFKIAKILASLFTHSSTPEEEKNYRAWLDENPEHQKIADRILNKETYEENSRLIKSFSSQKAWDRSLPATRRRIHIWYCLFVEKESEICGSYFAIDNTGFIPYI